jgi:hypothetical protein
MPAHRGSRNEEGKHPEKYCSRFDVLVLPKKVEYKPTPKPA